MRPQPPTIEERGHTPRLRVRTHRSDRNASLLRRPTGSASLVSAEGRSASATVYSIMSPPVMEIPGVWSCCNLSTGGRDLFQACGIRPRQSWVSGKPAAVLDGTARCGAEPVGRSAAARRGRVVVVCGRHPTEGSSRPRRTDHRSPGRAAQRGLRGCGNTQRNRLSPGRCYEHSPPGIRT